MQKEMRDHFTVGMNPDGGELIQIFLADVLKSDISFPVQERENNLENTLPQFLALVEVKWALISFQRATGSQRFR